eukprot:1861462-Amphidinium_carterae.1
MTMPLLVRFVHSVGKVGAVLQKPAVMIPKQFAYAKGPSGLEDYCGGVHLTVGVAATTGGYPCCAGRHEGSPDICPANAFQPPCPTQVVTGLRTAPGV